MASGDTSLGSLGYSITGDYSELQDALEQADSLAQSTGQSITEALNVPNAGEQTVLAISGIGQAATDAVPPLQTLGDQATQLGDAGPDVSTLTDAVTSVGTAADETVPSVQAAAGSAGQLGDAAEQAGESAEEAGSRLKEMAEALVGVGEALAVTEGLKEFGEEALEAYGTVQSVTIGLTSLTGSAGQADEAIEQIKQLAATEPFAFPDIAPTIQRMVALGVSTAQLQPTMQAVADASAATGNQFNAVASSLDRMALSGTAGARQLVQLGISATDLGAAMGVTSDQVTTAFKALDQSQRITVLDQALGKFAGDAIAQAQGISGQWQIFENNFEEVMVGVGQAITPAVSAILDFGKSVLSGIQQAVDAFNALPDPIKEVVGLFGIAVAAIAPLTAAAGSLGLGLIGVQAIIVPLNTLLTTLGITSGEAAVGEGAAAVAAEGLAVADNEAAIATRNLATSQEAQAAAGETAATSAIVGGEGAEVLGTGMLAAGAASGILEGAIVALGAAFVGWNIYTAVAGTDDLKSSVGDAAGTVSGEGTPAIKGLGSAISDTDGKVTTATPHVNDFGTAVGNIPTKTTTATTSVNSLGQTVTTITESFGKTQTAAQAAAGSMANTGTSAQAAVAPTTTFQKAVVDAGIGAGSAATAVKNLGGSMGTAGEDASAALAQMQPLVTWLNQLSAATQKAAAAQAEETMNVTVGGQAQIGAAKALTENYNAQVAANKAVVDAKTALDLAKASSDGGSVATQLITNAQIAYDQALVTANPHGKDWADTIAGITQNMTLAAEKATSSISVYDSLNAKFDEGTASLGAVAEAYKKAQTAATAAGQAFATAAGQQALMNQSASQTKALFDANVAVLRNLETALASGTLSANQQTVAQQQLLTVYKSLQSEATTLGTSFYDPIAAMETLTVQAADQQTALNNVITTYESLKTSGNTSAAAIEATGAAFKTVQTDAGNLGLTVTQVGNGLVFTANAANQNNPQVVKLADSLTQAANAGQNFVTVNGKLTPMLQDIGSNAAVAAGQVGKLVTTADGGTVAVIGLSNAAPGATKAVTDLGTAADKTASSHKTLAASVNTATAALNPFSAAAVASSYQISTYGGAAATASQVTSGQLTPSLKGAVSEGLDPFLASSVAATIQIKTYGDAISNGAAAQAQADTINRSYNNGLAASAAMADAAAKSTANYMDAGVDAGEQIGLLDDTLTQDQSDLENATSAAVDYESALDAVSGAANAAASSLNSLDESMNGAASGTSNLLQYAAEGAGFASPTSFTDIDVQGFNPVQFAQAAANATNSIVDGALPNTSPQDKATALEAAGFSTAEAEAIAGINQNTAATSSNTSATSSNTTATTAAATATTSAITATTALQNVNTALGTSFTDTGSALQALELLVSETGGSVQSSLEGLISQINGANDPLQAITATAGQVPIALGLLSTGLSSTGQQVNQFGVVIGSASTGLTDFSNQLANINDNVPTLVNNFSSVTSSATTLAQGQINLSAAQQQFNSTMETLNEELSDGTITFATFNEDISNASVAVASAGAAFYSLQQAFDAAATGIAQLGTAASFVAGKSTSTTENGDGTQTTVTTNPNGTTSTVTSALPGEQVTGTGGTGELPLNGVPGLIPGFVLEAGTTDTYQQAPSGNYSGGLSQFDLGGNPLTNPYYANPAQVGGYGGPGSTGTPAAYSAGNPLPVTITNGQPPQINITIPGATIIGSNGAQQLANLVQQQLVTTLRQAGYKL